MTAPRPRAVRPARRLRLEALEDRSVPALITVTILDDAGPGSLRQAILDANATDEADDIDFAPALGGTIVLTTGELPITHDLTITGPGAALLAVSGDNTSRVFNVDDRDFGTSRKVAIRGLTVDDGSSDQGGGIRTAENLTLVASTVSGNVASGFGGGIVNYFGTLALVESSVSGNAASDFGGGIFNYGGTMAVTASTVSGNTTGNYGGGVSNLFGTAALANSTVSGNTAGIDGGGVSNVSGTLTVTGGTVSGNTAANFGGGVSNLFGTLALTNSTVSGNTAGNAGGGVSNRGYYYSGPYGSSVAPAVATLTGVTVAGNAAATGAGWPTPP